MLAGPVAIGAPLLMVGPWGAITVGIAAGAVSALSFIFLHPRLCKAIKTLDVMGVHNLHAMGGWVGVVASIICLVAIDQADFIKDNVISAVGVVAITIITGIVIGLVVKLTRGDVPDEELFSDDVDFIKTEEPTE
jgi:ammonium transporter Rh